MKMYLLSIFFGVLLTTDSFNSKKNNSKDSQPKFLGFSMKIHPKICLHHITSVNSQ